MDKETYTKELASLYDYIRGGEHHGFQAFWERPRDYERWAMAGRHTMGYWDVVKGLPPLIAAAEKHGRPDTGGGKWFWSLVSPEIMERIFGDEMKKVVEQFKDIMASVPEAHRGNYYEKVESFILAYKHLNEFAELLKAAGVTQYKTSLTDHGMSTKEVKALEKWLSEKEAEIEADRNPAPKESLFEAPKKGKYPKFDDTEYSEYLGELREKYSKPLDRLIDYGLPLVDNHFEEMAEKLADFDFVEISATLGAQKRQPPDENGAKTYELYANLMQRISDRFAETTVADVDKALAENLKTLSDPVLKSMHGYAFDAIREIRRELSWLLTAFPAMDCPALVETRIKVAQAFDPRWALMSGGPLHEKLLKEIVFTRSPSMPTSVDDIPDSLNPAKEAVYGHVFFEQSLANLGTMYFVMMGNERLQVSKKVLNNPHLAYQVLQLFPDPSVGRDPALIRTFGTALQASADSGELLVEFSPDMTVRASGTLKLKMTAADIKKIPARTDELAAAAEANQTAEAVLPEVFAKAQKWPYKDKVLAAENVKTAIETAWEYDSKQKIVIKHMRVNHYRPGREWDQEMNPRKEPIARLTFSYVGIIYEYDGKTFCVEDGIQLRQFYQLREGYGGDLNVLFWGAKPYALPPEQVKRIAK